MAMTAWLVVSLLAGAPQEVLHRPQVEDAATRQRRQEAETRFQAGLDALHSEHYADAEEELRTAVRLDPRHFLAYYALGQTYMAMKEYDDAVKAYSACRQAYLEVAAASKEEQLETSASREDEIRRLRDRLSELQDALARMPSDSSQRMLLQSRTTNLEAGIRALERLRGSQLNRSAPPAEFTLALGSAYFRAGRHDDAKREYIEAVRLQPGYGEAHNNLAVIYMLEGNLDEAEAHLKAAEKAGVKVNPDLKKEIKARRQRR